MPDDGSYLDRSTPPNSIAMSPKLRAANVEAETAMAAHRGAMQATDVLATTGRLSVAGVLPVSASFGSPSLGTPGGGVDLVAGLQAVITDAVAQQRAFFDNIKEQQVVAERTASYMADAANKMVTVATLLSSGTTGAIPSGGGAAPKVQVAAGETTQSPKAALPISGMGPAPARTRKRARGPDLDDVQERAFGEDPAEDARDAAVAKTKAGFARTRGGVSLTSIRAQAATYVGTALERHQEAGGLSQTTAPMELPGGFALPSGVVTDEHGNAVDHDVASSFIKRARWGKSAQNILSRVGGAGPGQGWAGLAEGLSGESAAMNAAGEGGALASGMGLAAGGIVGVGAAAAAYQQGIHFTHAQAEANRGWQSMLGGSQGDAFGQRMRSQAFEIGSLFDPFGMGAGSRSKLFHDVQREGFTEGHGLNTATQFGQSNYRRFGMSVDDSMELISISAQQGRRDLTGLSEALKQVSDSARGSGIALDTAREKFTQTYGTLSQQLGAGPGTVAVAAGMSTWLNTQGAAIANNVDLTGMMTNRNTQLRVAAASGMTLPQTQAFALSHKTDYLKLANNVFTDSVRTVVPNAEAIVQRELAKLHKKPGDHLESWEADAIGQVVIAEGGAGDITQAKSFVTDQTGVPFENDQAFGTYIVNNIANPSGLVNAAKAAEGETRPHVLKGGAAAAQGVVAKGAITRQNLGGRSGSAVEAMGLSYTAAAAQYRAGKLDATIRWDGPSGNQPGGDAKATFGATLSREEFKKWQAGEITEIAHGSGTEEAYSTAVGATKIQSPLAEWILKQNDKNMKLMVTDKAGQKRQVSIQDAMKHYYDQIVQDKVTIASGDHKGKSLSEASGITISAEDSTKVQGQIDSLVKSGGAGASHITHKGDDAGKSLSDKDVRKIENAQGTTGHVIIEAGPLLAKYISVSNAADPRSNAAANGTTPPSQTTVDLKAP